VLNRWIGIACGTFWLLANVAILWRDVLPHWLAGDPPPNEALLLAPGEKHFVQVGIYDNVGRAVGTSWTTSTRVGVGGLVAVKTTTVLQPIVLPAAGGVVTPRVRVEMGLTYRAGEATVDTLDFKMFGLPVPISLEGEAMPSGEFPFTWRVGDYRGKAMLDSRVPAALGDVIRPFDRLPNLYVGRSWRLDLLDPFSQLVPQLKQADLSLEPILVQVTRRETILHQGRPVDAYVVEGGGATAWVAQDGRVLRQEVVLPLLGKLILRDEPYDEDARRRVILSMFGRGASQPAPDEESFAE
jgi:uncharacterized protein (DUF697 family)